jgi:hypothetical protein
MRIIKKVKKDIIPKKDVLQKLAWDLTGEIKFSCIKVE